MCVGQGCSIIIIITIIMKKKSQTLHIYKQTWSNTIDKGRKKIQQKFPWNNENDGIGFKTGLPVTCFEKW